MTAHALGDPRISASVAKRSDGMIVLAFYRGEGPDPEVTTSMNEAMASWLVRELAAALGGTILTKTTETVTVELPDVLQEMRAKYPATFRVHGLESVLAAALPIGGAE